MGFYHVLNEAGEPKGKRHAVYDRDPERLHQRIKALETPRKTTFSDVLDGWERAHREDIKPRTWANYAPHVADLRGLYGAEALGALSTADVIQDLQAAKARGYSFTVVNSRRCIWRMALDYAVAERLIQYNFALGVKNPKGLPKGKRSAPEDDVLSAILAGANDLEFGFIPFFLLCTGLRRSEALERPRADVDLKAWEIRIPKAKTEAGVRRVPIIEPLREPLRAWMDAHPGEWLFPHVDYYAGRKAAAGYMSARNWEREWLAYCTKNNLVDADGKPTLGAHNLRHGTATLLYEAGVDVYTAQAILGHADVTTTLAIYTELRRKHEQKNVKKFSRSLSKLLSKAQKMP